MKIVYVVSYSSNYDEIYNEVKLFSSKEEAIKHCNSVVEDINLKIDEKDRKSNVFDDYIYGNKEYSVSNSFNGKDFLLTLNEMIVPLETSDKIIAPSDEEEECIDIYLTPERYPIAFKNKVDELLEQGCFETREEAEADVRRYPIQLDLVYEKHSGLFAVESEALELCTSPYSGKEIEIDEN